MSAGMYMKIEGPNVAGECMVEGKKDWINLSSFTLGVTQPGRFTTGKEGATKGISTPHDVIVTKETDSSTHALYNHCFGGEHFDKVMIEVLVQTKQGLECYFRVTMEHVIVSSMNGGGAGDNTLQDNVSFNYSDITIEYAPKTNDGNLGGFKTARYNVQTGKHG